MATNKSNINKLKTTTSNYSNYKSSYSSSSSATTSSFIGMNKVTTTNQTASKYNRSPSSISNSIGTAKINSGFSSSISSSSSSTNRNLSSQQILSQQSNKYESPYKTNGYKSAISAMPAVNSSYNNSNSIINNEFNNNLNDPMPYNRSTSITSRVNPFYKEFGIDSKYYDGKLYKNPLLPTLATSAELTKWPINKPTPSVFNKSTVPTTTSKLISLGTLGSGPTPNNPQNSTNNKLVTLNQTTKPEFNQTTKLNNKNSYIDQSLKERKGYLIIFNQEKFQNKEYNREGSIKDEEALCRTFWNYNLKSPVIKRNCKTKEIKAEVAKLSTFDFRKYTCFVAVILSHGNENGTIYSYDNTFNVEMDFIRRIATNKTLLGKPKIFIINACKGSTKHFNTTETDNNLQADSVLVSKGLPYIRDILTIFSTYEGFVSWRDPSKGTIFIQTFCKILNDEGKKLSIEDIIKKVNTELTEGPNQNKQVPTVQTTMSANFYFGDLLKH